MALKVSSSISVFSPEELFDEGFGLQDQSIIPSKIISSSFTPGENNMEAFIYDESLQLVSRLLNYNEYKIEQNSSTTSLTGTDQLQLDPTKDLTNQGYVNGTFNIVYNFLNYELSSSLANKYFISEISSDRTEIRLKNNSLSNDQISSSYNVFKDKIDNVKYFDEFYISDDENHYNIGVNCELDTSNDTQYSILIKLYNPLTPTFNEKDLVLISTKVAESQGYKITLTPDQEELNKLLLGDVTYLKGPNTNLEIKDFVNNSTELKSKDELINSPSTSSKNTLDNKLSQKGVKIEPNYSYNTFSEFVNFSSAKSRIQNFYEKVSRIQGYENDLTTLNAITGSTSSSLQTSASKATLEANISTEIKNFDGYEYYLYYESSSFAYPKTGSSYPYELLATSSTEVLTWLGSDVENHTYYGGILLSASYYDYDNQNWLWYTIPEFIKSNQNNDNYIEFSNMVGQHFDEIWLYTKALSERYNTTNQLDKGLPLKLAQDAIVSLGYEKFGNNYNNENNFIGLIGEDNGIYTPSTGSETITNYIAINGGSVVNYWNPSYSFLNYVQQLGTAGYPYAIEKVSEEIYKRLYHNMAYLVKKKGTVSGLRQLINIWGIPNTILRINEFGGKNKDNTDDYDYWYNRYNYAFTAVANQHYPSASVVIPWRGLDRNRLRGEGQVVPDSVQFRFKTFGYPSSSYSGDFFTQSLAVKKSDSDVTSTAFDWGIELKYTGSITSSNISGALSDTYRNWGEMRFYISGAVSEGGTVTSDPIYLPFFDEGWWSVMLQRDTHVSTFVSGSDTTYTLYAKNKIYNGFDGNNIGFEGSSSIFITGSTSSSINNAWNKMGTETSNFQGVNGVYLGGFVSGAAVGEITIQPSGDLFSGSLQEFRYYAKELPETVFNDYVMNPESIEGTAVSGTNSSFDICCFRAPLGNELEDNFTVSISASHTESFTSMHPAVTASAASLITQSFAGSASISSNSDYYVQYYANDTIRTYSKTNKEVYFLDQPAVGVRNRISNKIQVDDGEVFGDILSTQTSIQQDYQISRSYTEDVTNLEVAFSPQDEVNDDIIQSFGFGVISDALADPRLISESVDYYPQLKRTAEYYFQKYIKGNIYDYLRLIKYVDASLFKAIKAYVPARTSVSTGIVIKQHMLERTRFAPPSITKDTIVAFTPETGSVDQGTPQEGFNSPIYLEDIQVSGSIKENTIKGGTGGVVESFNYYGPTTINPATGNSGSASFGQTPITQSWNDTFDTTIGLQTIVQNKQDEFYDGEFSGSRKIATTQSLFFNPYKIFSGTNSTYNLEVTQSNYNSGVFIVHVETGSNLNDVREFVQNWAKAGPHVEDDGSDSPGIIQVGLYERNISGYKQYQIVAIAFPFTSKNISQQVSASLFPDNENIKPNASWPYETPSGGRVYGYRHNFNGAYWNFFLTGSGGTFENDAAFNNVPGNKVVSTTLTPIETYVTGTLDRMKVLLYEYSSRHSSDQRDRTWIAMADDGAQVNFPATQSNVAVSWSYAPHASQVQINRLNANPVGNSTASFNFFPTTWGDGNTGVELAPTVTAISNFSINNGVTHSMQNSLLNDPQYSFEFTHSNQPQTLDLYNLSGSVYNTDDLYMNTTFVGGDQSGNTSTLFGWEQTGRHLSGSSAFSISSSTLLLSFNPTLPGGIGIYNTVYNATQSVSDNRDNSYLMDVDYSTNAVTPVNLQPIRELTAKKAQVPDSYYTKVRIINPRYNGCKVMSADYNNYTPAVRQILGVGGYNFLNGDTGSWDGDKSYGNVAAIDQNPIYFAHFKNSIENKELFDTYTFKIDALIESPKEDIQGLVIEPNIIKIDGSNKNLSTVSSTFEKSRNSIINYGKITKDGVNYTTLSVGSNKIFQGGLEYNTLVSNTVDEITQVSSMSFGKPNDNNPGFNRNNWSALVVSPIDFENAVTLLQTSSTANVLTLRGTTTFFTASLGTDTTFSSQGSSSYGFVGTSLAIVNSMNTWVSMSLEVSASTTGSSTGAQRIHGGIPKGQNVNPANPFNYYQYNFTGSGGTGGPLGIYEDFKQNFIVKRGDEIRIIYNSISGSNPPSNVTQDFTVLSVQTSSLDLNTGIIFGPDGNTSNVMWDKSRYYDTLVVDPNPQDFNIPKGRIYSATIRRRVQADDRVIVYQLPPSGSNGSKTTTPDGYIIPSDFSETQKRNVQTLINQLKGKNVFREDDLDG